MTPVLMILSLLLILIMPYLSFSGATSLVLYLGLTALLTILSFIRRSKLRLLYLLIFALCTSYFGIRTMGTKLYKTKSVSMMPTVWPGDYIYLEIENLNLYKGVIVAFKKPGDDNLVFLGRIVASGGDRVKFYDGHLTLNSKSQKISLVTDEFGATDFLEKKYEKFKTDFSVKRVESSGFSHLIIRDESFPSTHIPNHEEIRVPNDSFYILCDNRQFSIDSRFFGPVNQTRIMGKVKFVYWNSDYLGNRFNYRFYDPEELSE